MIPKRLAVVAPLLLTACVSLTDPAPVPERYVLHSHAEPGEKTAVPARLGIAQPRVPPGLESEHIVVLRNGRRLDHLARARWAAPLPKMLQAFFHEALERRFPRLEADPAPGGMGNLRLGATVWAFQAEYQGEADSPPRLRLAMTLRLYRPGKDRTLARMRVARTAPAASNRRTAVVAGLEGLLDEAFADAVAGLWDQWHGGG
jgi:uncharacterized lipoprotein YmbA